MFLPWFITTGTWQEVTATTERIKKGECTWWQTDTARIAVGENEFCSPEAQREKEIRREEWRRNERKKDRCLAWGLVGCSCERTREDLSFTSTSLSLSCSLTHTHTDTLTLPSVPPWGTVNPNLLQKNAKCSDMSPQFMYVHCEEVIFVLLVSDEALLLSCSQNTPFDLDRLWAWLAYACVCVYVSVHPSSVYFSAIKWLLDIVHNDISSPCLPVVCLSDNHWVCASFHGTRFLFFYFCFSDFSSISKHSASVFFLVFHSCKGTGKLTK